MRTAQQMITLPHSINVARRRRRSGGGGSLRICGCLLLLVATWGVARGNTVTFEDQNLAANSYFNGDPGNLANGQSVSLPIVSGGVAFSNTFSVAPDGSYTYWSGFSTSNVVNTTDPDFTNQYASYPGGGYQSSNYGIAYGDGASFTLPTPGNVSGFEIANTTYAYLTMANGDPYGFTAPLASPSGYLAVTAAGFLQGNSTGSAEFYLADFRTLSSPGILPGWAWFDLSALGSVDTVSFTFTGSDTGIYGLNTPAYFAIDNLTYGSVPEIDPASAGSAFSFGIGSLALLERRWRRRLAAR
jgi:hypothetical protein